jgi:hypothetical protein
MPAGQEISFQPPLALVLAEHRVQHAAVGREELVVLHFARIPLAVGDFKDRAEQVRQRLIRSEDAEIARLLIQLHDISQELAEHHRILPVHRAGRRDMHRMIAEVRHFQIVQQNAPVGVGIGAHSPIADRRQLGQLRIQPAVRVE